MISLVSFETYSESTICDLRLLQSGYNNITLFVFSVLKVTEQI